MSIIRDVTIKAEKFLDNDDILIFVGARQAGKTTILKQLRDALDKRGEVSYFINLEDPEYLDLLNESPKNIFKIFTIDLDRKNFIFVDEIQYLNDPSNFLKYIYDEYQGKIKLLVSGSSAFYIDDKFKDSLAGRKKIFEVLTLSFREFLHFKGELELLQRDFDDVSLSDKEKIRAFYREYFIYGGYPRVVLSPFEEKVEVLHEIAYSYIKKDIFESNIRQDEIFFKLFKILSSQIGSLFNASEISSTLDVSKTAIDKYIYVMRKSFHVALVRPFFRNARKELSKMPKVFFYDLGLRNFFSDNFNEWFTRDDKGQLLENAVFRQLLNGHDLEEIKFWRTTSDREVDFIVDGKIAIEVKADVRQFKPSKYKTFLEKYPDINLSVASFDIKEEGGGGAKKIEVWQI